MIELGTEVPELTAEHADGTWWADVEGDLWCPHPLFGWLSIRRVPFAVLTAPAYPSAIYGPYRAVLRPPDNDT